MCEKVTQTYLVSHTISAELSVHCTLLALTRVPFHIDIQKRSEGVVPAGRASRGLN